MPMQGAFHSVLRRAAAHITSKVYPNLFRPSLRHYLNDRPPLTYLLIFPLAQIWVIQTKGPSRIAQRVLGERIVRSW